MYFNLEINNVYTPGAEVSLIGYSCHPVSGLHALFIICVVNDLRGIIWREKYDRAYI
jgi:hypothetical protein